MVFFQHVAEPGWTHVHFVQNELLSSFLYSLKKTARNELLIFLIPAAEAPYIEHLPSDVQVNQNSQVLFTCTAIGDPRPNITWRYNGTDLPSSMYAVSNFNASFVHGRGSFGANSTLTLPSVLNNNAQGMYTCVATNVYNSAIANARLSIFGKT